MRFVGISLAAVGLFSSRVDSQCSARTGSSEWEARRRAWRLDYDRRQKLGAVEGSVAVSTTGQAGRISKSRETLVSLNG